MEAETFVQRAEPSSFHAASVRFCLAYLPWRHIVRGLANLLLPEGQLGILTNLGTSAPQAWEVYRGMVDELGVPRVDLPVPSSLSDLEHALQRGGFQIAQSWTETFRLRFDSGQRVAAWLEESGFIAHPQLRAAPIALRRALWAAFASRIERYREPHGIPLDFELAGVVAVHSCSAHPPQTD